MVFHKLLDPNTECPNSKYWPDMNESVTCDRWTWPEISWREDASSGASSLTEDLWLSSGPDRKQLVTSDTMASSVLDSLTLHWAVASRSVDQQCENTSVRMCFVLLHSALYTMFLLMLLLLKTGSFGSNQPSVPSSQFCLKRSFLLCYLFAEIISFVWLNNRDLLCLSGDF